MLLCLKLIMPLLILMWQGIIDAVHYKSLYGGVGSGNEGRARSIKTGGFVCPSVSWLTLSHRLWIPRGNESIKAGGVRFTAREGLQRATDERQRSEGSKIL